MKFELNKTKTLKDVSGFFHELGKILNKNINKRKFTGTKL